MEAVVEREAVKEDVGTRQRDQAVTRRNSPPAKMMIFFPWKWRGLGREIPVVWVSKRTFHLGRES